MPLSDDMIKYNQSIDYKHAYRNLTKKLMILLQENECYKKELRETQGQIIQATRDKNYLLERLMRYENFDSSTSGSDETDLSDIELPESNKRIKGGDAPHDKSTKKRKASGGGSRAPNSRSQTSVKLSQSSTIGSSQASSQGLNDSGVGSSQHQTSDEKASQESNHDNHTPRNRFQMDLFSDSSSGLTETFSFTH